MPHHLEPLPSWPVDESLDPWEPGDDPDGGFDRLVRPAWWRWVAIAVIAAMVAAGPIAFALSRLLS